MVITLPLTTESGAVRARLEDKLEKEYEGHTEHLATLTARSAGHRARHDLDTAATAARHAIGEIAAALRRMAEGRYGACEACRLDIPLARLEIEPALRFCPSCAADAAY